MCLPPLMPLRFQAAEDVSAALPGSSPIPEGGASASEKGAVVDAAVAWVERAIAADRKIGALKTLQVSSCSVCSDRPSMFMSFLLICNVGICP